MVKDGKPIGIVTESDLVKKVFAAELNLKEVKVSDFMSKPLITVTPDYDIVVAASLMKSNHIRHLPIVKEGKLVGIITSRDILKHLRPYINTLVRSVLFE